MKTKISVILFLIAIMAIPLLTMPASAHDPPWTIHSWCYIAASPDPIGVGQPVLLVFWGDYYPATSSGEYGDRYTFHVTATKPDGQNETLAPVTSDPVGGGFLSYTPNQVGNYTFQVSMDEVVYGTTGIYPSNVPKADYIRAQWFGDVQEAAISKPITLTVQQEQIGIYPSTPLPTDYWTRPIYATNREWHVLGSNWLSDGSDSVDTITCTAPETAHIIWTKPTTFGGIVGGTMGDISYHTGSAYESWWRTSWSAGRPSSFIMNGRIYYSEPQAPRYGYYCVDMRTGEQLFWQNSTGPVQIGSQTGAHISSTNLPWMFPTISFGQIMLYDTGNQHGASPYVWSYYSEPEATTYSYKMLNGTTYSFSASKNARVWQMSDPFTGDWIASVTNVPSGTQVRGPNGEILIYSLSNFKLRIWNTTVAMGWPNNNLMVDYGMPGGGGSSEAYYWMWREPIGRTVDGRNGFNPTNITLREVDGNPSIVYVQPLEFMLLQEYDEASAKLHTYRYDLTPGREGNLEWQSDIDIPYPVTASTSRNRWRMGPVGEGYYCMNMKEDTQWYGFSLETGNKVWGPAQAEDAFQMYGMDGMIKDGKLYSAGYGGIYCYDVSTGDRLWRWTPGSGGLEDPYPNIGDSSMILADGKIYTWTGEHSHTQPLFRSWVGSCVNATTGETIWQLPGLWQGGMIADGYYVNYDNEDNQIYTFGKGQTQTTVSASPKTSVQGETVLVEGSVTDQSPGAKDTPAIADENMSPWMEYIYRGKTKPTDATGVEVIISVLDPNNNFYEVTRTTSDNNGLFKASFTPEVPGTYTVAASFKGSKSYFPSEAGTAITVGETPTATQQAAQIESLADIYFVPAVVGLLIAVIAVGAVLAMLMLKKK